MREKNLQTFEQQDDQSDDSENDKQKPFSLKKANEFIIQKAHNAGLTTGHIQKPSRGNNDLSLRCL